MTSAVDGRPSRAAFSAFFAATSRSDAVQRHPAVVADDPAAAVRVGQAGDDVRAAGGQDVGRVGVEHAVVVGLAVPGEDLPDGRVQGVAVGGEARLHHPQAAVGHDRAAQRRVGLQPGDQLVIAVDVARGVAGDRGRGVRVGVVDAARPLLGEHPGQPRPQRAGPVGRAGQERRVAGVRREVRLDEVADVDLIGPAAAGEPLPRADPDLARLSVWIDAVVMLTVRPPILFLTRTYRTGRQFP